MDDAPSGQADTCPLTSVWVCACCVSVVCEYAQRCVGERRTSKVLHERQGMQASSRYAAGTGAGGGAHSHMPAQPNGGRRKASTAPLDRRASVTFTPPFHTAAIPQPSIIPAQPSQCGVCQKPSSPH
eukprot:3404645-Prymnesium_polylepis.1